MIIQLVGSQKMIAGETIEFMIGKNKFCIGYNTLDGSTLHFYTPRTPRNYQQLCDLPDKNLSFMRKNNLNFPNPLDFKSQNWNSNSSQLAISFHRKETPTDSKMVTSSNFGHFIPKSPTKILIEMLSKLISVNVIYITEHSFNNENYNFPITAAKTSRINAQPQDLNCSKWQLQIMPNTELIPMGKCIQSPKLINRGIKINFGWNKEQTTHANTLPECIYVYDSLKTIRIEQYFEMLQFQANSKSAQPTFQSTNERKTCTTIALTNTEMKLTEKPYKMQLLSARISEVTKCREEEKYEPNISTKLVSPKRLGPATSLISHVVEQNYNYQYEEDMDTDILQGPCDYKSTTSETLDAIPNLILLPSSRVATDKFFLDQTVPSETLPGAHGFPHVETYLHDSSQKDADAKDSNNLKPNFTCITPNEDNSGNDVDEHTQTQTEMPQTQTRKIQMLGLRLGLSKRQRVAPLHPAYKKIKLGKSEE